MVVPPNVRNWYLIRPFVQTRPSKRLSGVFIIVTSKRETMWWKNRYNGAVPQHPRETKIYTVIHTPAINLDLASSVLCSVCVPYWDPSSDSWLMMEGKIVVGNLALNILNVGMSNIPCVGSRETLSAMSAYITFEKQRPVLWALRDNAKTYVSNVMWFRPSIESHRNKESGVGAVEKYSPCWYKSLSWLCQKSFDCMRYENTNSRGALGMLAKSALNALHIFYSGPLLGNCRGPVLSFVWAKKSTSACAPTCACVRALFCACVRARVCRVVLFASLTSPLEAGLSLRFGSILI